MCVSFIDGDDVSLEDELQPGALICMDCVRREGSYISNNYFT